MFYLHCGLDWLPLIDGWWGHCCADHDVSGLNWPSNIAFFWCLWPLALGFILAPIGLVLVTIGLWGKRLVQFWRWVTRWIISWGSRND